MQSLIDSVAEFTALRDRSEIELIVVSVMFEAIRPAELTLWRLASHGGELWLQKRARLTEDGIDVSGSDMTADAMIPLAARPAWCECYQSKAMQSLGRDSHGQHGFLFPVANERGLVGFIEVRREDPLSQSQESLVRGLLRVYRNHLRVLDYSEYDELTGLLNRKTFEDYFRKLVRAETISAGGFIRSEGAAEAPSRRDAQQSWLAVIDIDFFKRINDTFGHLYGDEVLVLLAGLMRKNFQECDHLFRSGGEEFVVIVEDMDTTGAARLLEKFRAAVEAFEFPQVGRVTVSIGYTRIRAGDNGSLAFGRADEALYTAKRQGRNQVLHYEMLVESNVLRAKDSVLDDVELF